MAPSSSEDEPPEEKEVTPPSSEDDRTSSEDDVTSNDDESEHSAGAQSEAESEVRLTKTVTTTTTPTTSATNPTPSTSADLAVPVSPPPSALMLKREAEREERMKKKVAEERHIIWQILVKDYAEHETQSDAEDSADLALDACVKKKVLHKKAMGILGLVAKSAEAKIYRANGPLTDAESDIKEMSRQGNTAKLQEATRHLDFAEGIMEDWPRVEEKLEQAAMETLELFYRPKVSEEPGTKIMNNVKLGHEEYASRMKSARSQLRVLSVPVSAPPVSALAPPAEKKIFARDFLIKSWIPDPFTGEGDALKDFATFKSNWAHAETKVQQFCQEITPDAMLHLLGLTVEGPAKKVVKQAMSVEEALGLLAAKYDDIVGLTAAYLPSATPAAESFEEEAAEAIAFVKRWPSLEKTLGDHGISLQTYFVVDQTLQKFGPAAAKQWRAHVKTTLRELGDSSGGAAPKLGRAYNLTNFVKWIHLAVDKRAAVVPAEEGSSASLFAVAADNNNSETSGCMICGPSAAHRTPACQKAGKMSMTDYVTISREKGICGKCGVVPWTPAHSKVCPQKCVRCGAPHLSSRHDIAVAQKKKKEAKKKTTKKRERSPRPDRDRSPRRDRDHSPYRERSPYREHSRDSKRRRYRTPSPNRRVTPARGQREEEDREARRIAAAVKGALAAKDTGKRGYKGKNPKKPFVKKDKEEKKDGK